jgi:DNA repair protein RecO (recombination protein O)
MIESTKAIVLKSIKYGDTSLITTCYTENYGVKSYLLRGILKSKKSTIKSAYFQPLMQLQLTANHNNKGALNTLKEVTVAHFYNAIYTDIKKQTIALFLAEMVYNSIKEEEQNSGLFKYLEASFLWLDTHNNCSNFHLLFLLNLTKYLGFYPELNVVNAPYFDLLEGSFSINNKPNAVSGQNLSLFKKLLGINFDVLDEVDFSAANRQAVLAILVQYYELHLSDFKKPKSLNVLKAVFG